MTKFLFKKVKPTILDKETYVFYVEDVSLIQRYKLANKYVNKYIIWQTII